MVRDAGPVRAGAAVFGTFYTEPESPGTFYVFGARSRSRLNFPDSASLVWWLESPRVFKNNSKDSADCHEILGSLLLFIGY